MAEVLCKSDPVKEAIYSYSENISHNKAVGIELEYNSGNRRLIINDGGQKIYSLDPPKKPLGTPSGLDSLLKFVDSDKQEQFVIEMTNYIGSL